MRKVHLYAILLDDAVLESPRFKAANPGYVPGKACYYVGTSIHEPAKRFRMHMDGKRSSRWVRKYGVEVDYRKCHHIEVPNAAERAAAESDYAEELRREGYGIWQK